MKKYIQFIAFIFIFFVASLLGQSVFIGGNIGLNLSKFDYKDGIMKDGYDINSITGIKVGLFIEYPITSQFTVGSELNYTTRGADHKSKGIFIPPDYRFIEKLDYLEIPITLQYRIPLETIIKPKVFIGAEASFLLKAKTKYYENEILQKEIDSKNHFQSDEYGILFGIGMDYIFSTSKIIADMRYYYGLNNINEFESSETIAKTISFNICYAFSI